MCWCQIVVRPGQFIKRFLPRGLFGRSLIIIVAPMVLLQGVVTYVFFERDLDATTRRLARDVAGDVALLVTLEDSTPALERDGLRALSARQLRYRLTFHDGARLPPSLPSGRSSFGMPNLPSRRCSLARSIEPTMFTIVNSRGSLAMIARPLATPRSAET